MTNPSVTPDDHPDDHHDSIGRLAELIGGNPMAELDAD